MASFEVKSCYMRVLIIGPGTDVRGGIAHVIHLMTKYPPKGVEYRHFPTLYQAIAASHLSKKNPMYYAQSLKILSFFLRSLKRLHQQVLHIDLAHIHISSYGSTLRKYFVSKLLHRSGVPFILHDHGADYHLFYNRLPKPFKKRVRQMFLLAQGTIVLSEWWRDFHRVMVGKESYPLWVMPNPIELPVESGHRAGETQTRLLFLGRMDARKGSDRVLHAIAALPSEVRDRVRLYMAGDGEVDAMRALAKELGLESQVDIRSWIGGAEKETWLREANVFILPSRAEGLPMAMLEAMAYGKALIVSPVGGIPEFVTDGQEGILVPSEDISAIRDAIRLLTESPDMRAQMGRAARARIEPLSVERYSERLGAIYEEVLVHVQKQVK